MGGDDNEDTEEPGPEDRLGDDGGELSAMTPSGMTRCEVQAWARNMSRMSPKVNPRLWMSRARRDSDSRVFLQIAQVSRAQSTQREGVILCSAEVMPRFESGIEAKVQVILQRVAAGRIQGLCYVTESLDECSCETGREL